MARVLLNNVEKIYPGNVRAVRDFNLEIPDKEFCVFVGPSGCGKTTALRLIAGLEELSGGEIHIGERLVNHVSPKDRDVAMVFQNYALYPHMTVYDNMAFGLRMRHFAKAEIDRRVRAAAELLGITELLERKPKALSGGQRQRVAVGRAIVRKPSVFLFDEPLSNLDAKLRAQMRVELAKLHRRLQTTMIYVTHDQVEAMTMGDRIVVIRDGVIEQVGDPLQIYERPHTLFVAGFIGSPAMNLFEGRCEADNGEFYFAEGGFRLRLPREFNACLQDYPGKNVILGLRPEDIHLPELRPDLGAEQQVAARVEAAEPLGAETCVYLHTGHSAFVARLAGNVRAAVETTRKLAFDARKAHVFDPQTRRNISLTRIVSEQ